MFQSGNYILSLLVSVLHNDFLVIKHKKRLRCIESVNLRILVTFLAKMAQTYTVKTGSFHDS